MNIKASGRSALIIAAAFWACVSGPVQAAEDADGGVTMSKTESAAGLPVALNKFAKKSRHWKRASSQRKSVKVASAENARASEKKKAAGADAAGKADDSPSAIPPSIANANAQLATADLPADMNSVSTKASNLLRSMAAKQGDSEAAAPAANMEFVAADELNDVDRALSDGKSEEKPLLAPEKPALVPTVAMAMAQAPAAVSSSESTWDQTSLIGKIFIAFGGLLTLASAARMFMA
ncbi:MAG: hypothetical protein QOJ15_9625 [Bradyrhizobium sp.]|jgi:hypothetical protein|nr:hypothetical protein [Bradyrhizobium sp.]